eukprot:gnl/TRDRNA2_/TRDRNA2_177013_c0_seq1.p1 gnl/TRDRNA2_/TRDRNA2_177013_c0~~gnl/TRDRNA2_/TRDRNA2_177013_c0_seq1.p1  ORF type:complete len:335 (+),score=-6.71 gnl/TRDRNA2_/TRDRNA2_177013_c0_seq1:200-1204(+)
MCQLEYCRQIKAKQKMSMIMTKALLFHANAEELWLYAVSCESKNDHTTTRKLFQHGLQECKNSIKLWMEYFNFELNYINYLRDRFSPHNSKMICPDTLKEVESDALALNGTVSLTILKTAFRAFPSNLNLRFQCLRALKNVHDQSIKTKIAQEIYKSIEYDFADQKLPCDPLKRESLSMWCNNNNRLDVHILRTINVYKKATSIATMDKIHTKLANFVNYSLIKSRGLKSKSVSALNGKIEELVIEKLLKDNDYRLQETQIGVYMIEKLENSVIRTLRKNENHCYKEGFNLNIPKTRIESAIVVASYTHSKNISTFMSRFFPQIKKNDLVTKIS